MFEPISNYEVKVSSALEYFRWGNLAERSYTQLGNKNLPGVAAKQHIPCIKQTLFLSSVRHQVKCHDHITCRIHPRYHSASGFQPRYNRSLDWGFCTFSFFGGCSVSDKVGDSLLISIRRYLGSTLNCITKENAVNNYPFDWMCVLFTLHFYLHQIIKKDSDTVHTDADEASLSHQDELPAAQGDVTTPFAPGLLTGRSTSTAVCWSNTRALRSSDQTFFYACSDIFL